MLKSKRQACVENGYSPQRSELHPTFRKAGTQSDRVCPADSLAAEFIWFGGFLFIPNFLKEGNKTRVVSLQKILITV